MSIMQLGIWTAGKVAEASKRTYDVVVILEVSKLSDDGNDEDLLLSDYSARGLETRNEYAKH